MSSTKQKKSVYSLVKVANVKKADCTNCWISYRTQKIRNSRYIHSNINSATLCAAIESILTLSPITLLNFFTMKVTKKLVMYRIKGPFAMLACMYEIEK